MPSSNQSLGPAELCGLGDRFLRSGNFEQAAAAYYECLKLAPDAAIAATGLAQASRELGKLDIAVKVLETALRFNPKDGRLLSTLGAAYQEAGAHDRAIETLGLALASDGQNFDAAFNLGNTYRRIGDHPKAAVYYKQAVDIRPSDGDAQSTLASTLVYQGRIDEAARCYENAHILGDPDALYNLGMALIYGDDGRAAKSAFERAIGEAGNRFPGLASSMLLALLLYIEGDTSRSSQMLQRAAGLLSLVEAGAHRQDTHNMKAYHRYLDALLSSPSITRTNATFGRHDTLHIIGDSHVLGLKDTIISCDRKSYQAEVHWIFGCKQWHLGRDEENKYKKKFASVVERIPDKSPVLLSIGEIDARFGGGIFEFWRKQTTGQSLQDVVLNTVGPYVEYLTRHLSASERQIILCGSPAVNGSRQGHAPDEKLTHTAMIRHFNATLQKLGQTAGMGFLDLYALTDVGSGIADGSWHIDAVHLRPEAYLEAFKNHYIPAKS